MDSDQLGVLMERLTRAKSIEAAALLDVKDRLADEATAIRRRESAEYQARHAAERVQNLRLAIRIRIEAQTDCDFEPELDAEKITGPEQSGPHK